MTDGSLCLVSNTALVIRLSANVLRTPGYRTARLGTLQDGRSPKLLELQAERALDGIVRHGFLASSSPPPTQTDTEPPAPGVLAVLLGRYEREPVDGKVVAVTTRGELRVEQLVELGLRLPAAQQSD